MDMLAKGSFLGQRSWSGCAQLLGLEGDIDGNWSWTAYWNHGYRKQTEISRGQLYGPYLSNALGPSFVDANGNVYAGSMSLIRKWNSGASYLTQWSSGNALGLSAYGGMASNNPHQEFYMRNHNHIHHHDFPMLLYRSGDSLWSTFVRRSNSLDELYRLVYST